MEKLRAMLAENIEALFTLKDGEELMASQPLSREGIRLRNPYTDPLNFLQAELLQRVRAQEENQCDDLEQALMITMAGIAAGMRNTG